MTDLPLALTHAACRKAPREIHSTFDRCVADHKQASCSSADHGGGKRRAGGIACRALFLGFPIRVLSRPIYEVSTMETAVLVVGTISLFVAIYFGIRALQKKSVQKQTTRGGVSPPE